MTEQTAAAAALIAHTNRRQRTTLMDIGEDMLALAELLAETTGDDGEIAPEAAAALDRWFAELSADLETKADNTAAFVRMLQLRAKCRGEEADRLRRLEKADENLAERLKARLLWFMQERGIGKIDTRRFKISVVRNGGKQPIKLLLPPEQLPPALQRVTVAADMEAVREAVEQGMQGVAEILPRGVHLRVS